MFIFSSNKTGLWTILVLQFVTLSLCPAFAQPSLEKDDTGTDEDNGGDEDQVGDRDQDDSHDEDENDPTLGPAPDRDCEGKKGKDLDICILLWLVEFKTHLKKAEKAYALKSKSGPDRIAAEKDEDEYDD